MHFPEPKELYTLRMDGSGAGVEEAVVERRDHTCALRNILFLWGFASQPVGGS